MNKILFTFLILLTISTSTLWAQQKVKASYYANKFQGRLTASGIPYHRDSLTCAHKTLPFGTILKVVNPKNDKAVYVKVTDRGPFVKGRGIDLSYAAAKKIDLIRYGVANVIFTKVDNKEDIERIEIPDIDNLQKMELIPEDFLLPQDNTSLVNESIKLMPLVNKDNINLFRESLFPNKQVILQAINLLPIYFPRQKPLIVG